VRTPSLTDVLARHTPGRLMLFFLMALFALALTLSLLGAIPQSPKPLLFYASLLLFACWLANLAFAWAFAAKSNTESVLISALILILISSPSQPDSLQGLEFPLLAGIWAMASKYLFAVRHQPIFNPAALGVVCASILTTGAASWWIGNYWSLGMVLAGGYLLLRKMRCFDLVISFCGAVLLVSTLLAPVGYAWTFDAEIVTRSALLFFAFVMLTEPRTLPIGRGWRMAFGALVGLLYAPATHFGAFRFSPESALLVGNFFAAMVKWQRRRRLTLQRSLVH
jgi:Na+-translocating ferredoxin:NAD+ oxidoreductase RnfD subunit